MNCKNKMKMEILTVVSAAIFVVICAGLLVAPLLMMRVGSIARGIFWLAVLAMCIGFGITGYEVFIKGKKLDKIGRAIGIFQILSILIGIISISPMLKALSVAGKFISSFGIHTGNIWGQLGALNKLSGTIAPMSILLPLIIFTALNTALFILCIALRKGWLVRFAK